jgi:hypothetical protein
MKKNLLKKFSACLPLGMAFIITSMMFSASANAQIVYTDVNPDTTITCSSVACWQSYNLDLNNDATVDFTLYTSYEFVPCGITTFGMRQQVYVSSQSGNGIDTLMMDVNDTIGSNLYFSASSVTLRSKTFMGGSCNGSNGSWTSTSDHYLGLQITVGASTYYGWARLNVVVPGVYPNSTVYFRVKDYAYNSIPNQPILAGQTISTGIIENSFASSVNIFPNPATNHLTIALGSTNKKVNVTIADITGKIIYKTSSIAAQKIEVNTKDFAEGIYLVQVQSATYSRTEKLIITK